MWGNRLGWTLSAISVAAIIGFLMVMSAGAERAVPRTDFSRDSSHAALIELPVDPSIVLPDMIDPRDSSVTYRRAIEQCLFKPMVYEGFARAGQMRDFEDIPAVNILLEAAYSTSAELFEKEPSRIINYDNEKPWLDALRTLGKCANRVGMLIQDQRPGEAMKYYDAAFSLGIKLYRERLTWAELDTGLTMMAENARLIAALADALGQPDRAKAARQFDAARITYMRDNLLPTEQVLSSPDPLLIATHAGDVLYFAFHSPERMWRVEAIFALGRYRFHSERLGDQRAAARAIQDLTQDPDPIIRSTAAAARDLTEQQYHLMR